MSLLRNKLPQKVTWWPVTGSDGFGGGDIFGAASLIDARWEDRSELFRGPLDPKEKVSNAVVFLATDVAVGDYLYKGDQTAQPNPTLVSGSYKVQRFDKIPDLRSLDVVRRAVL